MLGSIVRELLGLGVAAAIGVVVKKFVIEVCFSIPLFIVITGVTTSVVAGVVTCFGSARSSPGL